MPPTLFHSATALACAVVFAASVQSAETAAPDAPPDYRDRILTPPATPVPRINGARVFGVRPNSPLLFQIAASGERPLAFAAPNLPAGLRLDPQTGLLTGRIAQPGEYRVSLEANNSHGTARRELRIVVGDGISLTPPMGWNSWYCWSESVSQENVLAMARVMAAKLAPHGWTYVNIDDCWQGERGGEFGGLQANEKFSDMAGFVSAIHALGLKAGIYSTPWMGSYAGFRGGSAQTPEGGFTTVPVMPVNERLQPGQLFGRSPGAALRQAQVIGTHQFTDRDARQYAAWGFDYIKYDWKNSEFTSPPMQRPVKRVDRPKTPESIARIARELRAVDRDIVLSLSPITDWTNHTDVTQWANLWRITADIRASWDSLDHVFTLTDWYACTAPGHWADPDMLQVGMMGVVNATNRTLRPSPLTADEQYIQMSFWCLVSAPLLLSCDLTALDDFTLSLLTNDEVIDIDQDSLGRAAQCVSREGKVEIWRKTLEDGSLAIGIFNRGDTPARASVTWPALNISGAHVVRDVWRQQDVATSSESFATDLNPHGVRLIRLRPAKQM